MHVRLLAWMWLVVGRWLAWMGLAWMRRLLVRLLVQLWGWVWILVLGWRLRTRDRVALLLRIARLTVAALHRQRSRSLKRDAAATSAREENADNFIFSLTYLPHTRRVRRLSTVHPSWPASLSL